MSAGQLDLLARNRTDEPAREGLAIPLTAAAEPLVEQPASPVVPVVPEAAGRMLVPADFAAPNTGPVDALLRWAYALGVPGPVLTAPLRKAMPPHLLASVACPLAGERSRGMALRAGHFLVGGIKAPFAQFDFASPSRLTPPFARALHHFDWLRDLAACTPRENCGEVAAYLADRWFAANPAPGKGVAWTAEAAGQRLLAALVHAPILLGRGTAQRRRTVLDALEATARWLDRHVARADDGLGQVAGWCGIVAAGLLLPDGRARRLFGEAGLLRALGEMVAEDGGVLSRSPLAQIDTIALLVELRACYEAVAQVPPAALERLLGLLVPPLLALRMGDGALGCWQGSGATGAARLEALVAASGVRARPAKALSGWGYHRLDAGQAVLVIDAAPPPRPRHARHGCASTLAFEFAHGDQRLIVNCGGAALAGGQVPLRIEQGLRGSAAHSTLTLDETNSTAILIKGEIGKGVEAVDCQRSEVAQGQRKAQRLEASHNGYSARYGLVHRRVLMLASTGDELRGEDILEPAGRKGKRGKIGFAVRFHLAPQVDVWLADDRRGASLALPDGSHWQFRLGGDSGEAALAIEDSLWVDGQGRPRETRQLVIEGLTERSGGAFPWLLKRMG